MFCRAVGIVMLFIFMVVASPVYALTDKELDEMSMDELVKLELRLEKILKIRGLESNIKKTQKVATPGATKASDATSGKFGKDSTSGAPGKISAAAPKPVQPVKQLRVLKPRAVQAGSSLSSNDLPKIVSIWGDLDKGLLANLEIGNGFLTVKEGDKILSGRYTVTAVTGTGVTVEDKRNKPYPLVFKPFEKVSYKKQGVVTQPTISGGSFGRDSVYVPPLPGKKAAK